MSTYFWNAENIGLYVSAKEATFGVPTNTTTNLAAQTFYTMWVKLTRAPVFFLKKNNVYEQVSGVGPDPTYAAQHGNQEGKMVLTGELYYLPLYFLCKACTTTDNVYPATDTEEPPTTVQAGTYVHDYKTTTARAAAPPTFECFLKMVNDTSANNKFPLYVGCAITAMSISGSLNSPITATIEIIFKNVLAGTALSAYPSFPSYRAFYIDDAVMVYAKGGSAYTGSLHAFTIEYRDGTYLHKPAGQSTATEPLNGPRLISIEITWAPKTVAHLNDTIFAQLDPATASDVDITLKISRNTTNDWIRFAFEKLWSNDQSDPTYFMNYHLDHRVKFVPKPAAVETGAVTWIREVNQVSDAIYEA